MTPWHTRRTDRRVASMQNPHSATRFTAGRAHLKPWKFHMDGRQPMKRIGVGAANRPPLPPNRTGVSHASGSPLGRSLQWLIALRPGLRPSRRAPVQPVERWGSGGGSHHTVGAQGASRVEEQSLGGVPAPSHRASGIPIASLKRKSFHHPRSTGVSRLITVSRDTPDVRRVSSPTRSLNARPDGAPFEAHSAG